MTTPSFDEQAWQAVISRDKRADGEFVYAVRTTGVFCRPSCASRQPRRENVRFFALPAAAEHAGFRPCKRCHPHQAALSDPRVALAQRMADHLEAHSADGDATSLAALSQTFSYAAGYVQEVFKEIVGVTPHQYVEALRLRQFRHALKSHESVAEAVYHAGYGSVSRAYERASDRLGMTPAQYQKGGPMLDIRYTTADTPLGTLLVAVTERGVCAVGLYDDAQAALSALEREYPQAGLSRQDEALNAVLGDVLSAVMAGAAPAHDLAFDVQATAFQWKVWHALQQIPRGETRTYSQIAHAIGQPTAARAVATACASNHLAVLIPCHRVIGADGALRGYKWGTARKAALLAREAQTEPVAAG
ncbi:MAG: bifunctional DNA-binding transcriptional regulator/O6-methylguanine-DNA methyltransferase Ada [Pleurocapsa minor GSE-CHR-MK-17-07R]|jgi:AraC family transcriptional regulator of adaptative response/methylated-DNA-[protein]-cysteine methyltransferase|nr:bifunctional DNA-binding transcriptional regulator/O6-methylguanine-DNA methyltransferase Ada [Pleurocapsa minor GSE-CHR-MK 17-07R]